MKTESIKSLLNKFLLGISAATVLTANSLLAASVGFTFNAPTVVNEGSAVVLTGSAYLYNNDSYDYISSSHFGFDSGGPAIWGYGDNYSQIYYYPDEGTHLLTMNGSATFYDGYTYQQWVQNGYWSWYSSWGNTYYYWVDTSHYETRVGYSGPFTVNQTLTRQLTVLNVAPTIQSVSLPTGDLTAGTPFSFSATATDPGVNDVLSYAWDLYGEGGLYDYFGANGTVTFDTPGMHALTLRVSDGDGGFAYGTYNVNVVAAPSVPDVQSSAQLLGMALMALGALRRHAKTSPNWLS